MLSGSTGSRLSGLTLRQTGMALTEERFPVVAADGAAVSVEDCWIETGSGHGIAVLGGSSAVLRSVRVTKCVDSKSEGRAIRHRASMLRQHSQLRGVEKRRKKACPATRRGCVSLWDKPA